MFSLELDEAEKKATDYLARKLNPKRIQTLGARIEKLQVFDVIVVSGWLEHQDGPKANFEVAVDRGTGRFLSWKTWTK